MPWPRPVLDAAHSGCRYQEPAAAAPGSLYRGSQMLGGLRQSVVVSKGGSIVGGRGTNYPVLSWVQGKQEARMRSACQKIAHTTHPHPTHTHTHTHTPAHPHHAPAHHTHSTRERLGWVAASSQPCVQGVQRTSLVLPRLDRRGLRPQTPSFPAPRSARARLVLG